MSEEVHARAYEQYRSLMKNVRARYDIIDGLKLSHASGYAELETAAFHLRKSIEGVAFGCLVALENGLRVIPRDAIGQWNADRIFSRLKKIDGAPFPMAIEVGDSPTADHHASINADANLCYEDVRQIYRRSHKWLHEMNPYIPLTPAKFDVLREQLLADILSIWAWLLHHLLHVDGEVFMMIMKNPAGELETISASANQRWPLR